MRPHNGWWRASSTPRRWIDLVQESPRWADGKTGQAPQQPPALAAKPAQAPAASSQLSSPLQAMPSSQSR